MMQEMNLQNLSFRFYALLSSIVQYITNPFTQSFQNAEAVGETQKNAYIWVIVFVLVVAAYLAACALVDKEFSGEIKFLGFYAKVKCI